MDKLKGSIKPFSVYHTDAYMIAVKNGFEGTEADWLKSLKLSQQEVDSAVARYLEENPVAIDKTLTKEGQAADAKATGEEIRKISAEAVNGHIKNKENPHNVTALQVGLGNVNNTPDSQKPVSELQALAIADAKKAGTDAKTAADKAQTAANNAKTAADDAQNFANELKTVVDNKLKPFTVVLTADKWEGEDAPYKQTIEVEGILATDRPHWGVVYSSEYETQLLEKEAFALVDDLDTKDGKAIFTCLEDKPANDLNIQMEVHR